MIRRLVKISSERAFMAFSASSPFRTYVKRY
jgi:hypothetical protein